jgi:stearoyl-CoA desaturase (delta-9 desaturase)
MTNFLGHGLFNLPWWGYVIYILAMTHVTILAVTIFLHRNQAHRALELHPVISQFFRFWLWMTTGMITKEWTAVHRKHHAFSDKAGDPHSPNVVGIKKVLFEGVELYQEECKNLDAMEKYGTGTPSDWIERKIYTPYNKLGIVIMLVINFTLFGPIGLSLWAIQMMWIPVNAAGIINGVGHYWGYRNFQCVDKSRNIVPIGFFIGGEELHNNHHTFGTSAKFSYKWYEFDLGWMWIRIFSMLGLATVKKVSPIPHISKTKLIPDFITLEAIVSNRYNLMAVYAKQLKKECKDETARLQIALHEKISWSRIRRLLAKDQDMLTLDEKNTVTKIMANSPLLQKIFALRADLTMLWQKSNLSREELLGRLQAWCKNAEASGIHKLQMFSMRLKATY